MSFDVSPEPPCTHYQCEMQPTCKAQRLACQAYVVYAIKGWVRSPLAQYERKGGRLKHAGYSAQPVATREFYEEAMSV